MRGKIVIWNDHAAQLISILKRRCFSALFFLFLFLFLFLFCSPTLLCLQKFSDWDSTRDPRGCVNFEEDEQKPIYGLSSYPFSIFSLSFFNELFQMLIDADCLVICLLYKAMNVDLGMCSFFVSKFIGY